MTQTTATAKLRFIPEDGTTVSRTAGAVEVKTFWTNGAGWTVMASRDGLTIHANTQPHEHLAVNLFNHLVEQYEAETTEATAEVEQPAPVAAPVEMPAPVKLAPAAKGSQTKVSDPGHTALAIAKLTGQVDRGGKPGQAPIGVLNALAKRGHLKLTYDETGRYGARKVVTGGVITGYGCRVLAELTAAEREAAEREAKFAIVATYATAA